MIEPIHLYEVRRKARSLRRRRLAAWAVPLLAMLVTLVEVGIAVRALLWG
jgi:hypothetical protein